MRNLLNKEIRLAASPLSFIFTAFAAMTFIPGYPILLGAFFICFGIFQTFQSGRENNDILYTVLLPVKKTDAVKARFLFVCFIELAGFILSAVFTLIRMLLLSQAGPYVNNAMMNANQVYLGYIFLIFTLFNCIFVRGYFKTGYKFARPLLAFIITAFILTGICEALHHFPGMEFLNSTSPAAAGKSAVCWLIFAACALIYFAGSLIAYKTAVRAFSRVDL